MTKGHLILAEGCPSLFLEICFAFRRCRLLVLGKERHMYGHVCEAHGANERLYITDLYTRLVGKKRSYISNKQCVFYSVVQFHSQGYSCQ